MSNPTSENPNLADSLLFEQFATLATAPDGSGRLRALILQLAVHGRLGTQDAGDEPASVLLERIQKEKERLVKEGKIPKEKPVDSPKTNDHITNVPKNWVLIRLGDISNKIHYGYTASADETNKKVRLIRITDIQNNHVIWDNVPGCEIDDSNYSSYAISSGDLLIARTGGTIGKSYLVREIPVPAVFASYLIRIVPNNYLDPEYVKLFADSPRYWNQLYEKCMGTGQPNVNGTSLRSLIVPLPPLAEQHRIVAKVDRLMALCDELEARQQQERAGCLKLGNASFAGLQNAESPEEFGRQWAQVCDAFDLILNCPENVAVLRQTILQLAVQGKLGTQDVEDEPAGKLVERIRKEKEQLVNEGKIKRERELAALNESEVSKNIPSSWVIAYLNDICELVADPDHNMPKAVDDGVKFISAKDLCGDGSINFETNVKCISEEDYGRLAKKIQPKKGDIIFSRIGSIGKSSIVKTDEKFMISYSCCVIRPLFVDVYYLNYFLRETSFLIVALQNTQGIGVPDLGMKMIRQFLVPLPPLAEQHRIVAKVDALMALCDQLEAQLKERAGMQGKFADAVVKSLGTG